MSNIFSDVTVVRSKDKRVFLNLSRDEDVSSDVDSNSNRYFSVTSIDLATMHRFRSLENLTTNVIRNTTKVGTRRTRACQYP